MDDMAFNDWLVEMLDTTGVSRVEFTERMSVIAGSPQKHNITRWWRGSTRPSIESCQFIARALGLDSREVLRQAGHWSDGDGLDTPVLRKTPEIDQLNATHFSPAEVKAGRRIVDALSTLTPAQLDALVTIARTLRPCEGEDEDQESGGGVITDGSRVKR